jgi:NADH:ubiquinone oxidoreductase subunit H
MALFYLFEYQKGRSTNTIAGLSRKLHQLVSPRNQTGDKKGIFGQLQPFADGFKLIIKESVIPIEASILLFKIMPLLALILPLISWAILPLSFSINYL